jgi:outer membrane protein TolC
MGLDAPSIAGDPFVGPREANLAPPVTMKIPEGVDAGETLLPINLPSAFMLSDARPLIIDAAKAAEIVAAAQLLKANVLWLPNIYAGIDYFRHDGLYPSSNGAPVFNNRAALTMGPGVSAIFATTDAIYEPLAARQLLRARQMGVQAAKNDALMDVAVTYFNVQQARGRMAGAMDTVARAKELVRRVTVLSKDLVAPIEADRARTILAEQEEVLVKAKEDWQVAAADLARLLRLNPAARITPTEPPHMALFLIAPSQEVDSLIPLGLTNRPELAASQAIVQATLTRLKQERMRPLIPSLVLQGNSGANGNSSPLIGGSAAAGNIGDVQWGSRFDVNAVALWELKNFGAGNRALIREREGQRLQANVELFMTQDRVAAEVAQAHAQLRSGKERVRIADGGLREALINYDGNLKGMSETTRFGDLLVLINRPQEVVASLQQLDLAYQAYFKSVQDYNRAQFRLFRAMGYPAEALACKKLLDSPVEVDTSRPYDLPPVTALPWANNMIQPVPALRSR